MMASYRLKDNLRESVFQTNGRFSGRKQSKKVHLPGDLWNAIDEAAETEEEIKGRSELVKTVLTDYLEVKGELE